MPNGVPQIGVGGAQDVIQRGTQQALGLLGQGIGQARQDITAGTLGLENQAALAGLRGAEAQQAAFNQFTESPGQQFLREQSERAILRNAAATGGLGGGNVLQELQRNAIGLAQQDLQNQFNRAQSVLGTQQQSARDAANIAQQGGLAGANLVRGATEQLGGQRFAAGQQLAQAATGTGANLANLQQQLGQGLSGITGQTGTNIANLISGIGQGSSQAQQNLAALLANIGTGGASQIAQAQSLAGQFDAAGVAGQNAAIQNAIQQLIQLNQQGGGS